MKLCEIEVGGRYVAKVSGNLTIVRVLAIREVPPAGYSRTRGGDRWKTRIDVVNERTRRKLTFASAARLRRPARPAGEPQKEAEHGTR